MPPPISSRSRKSVLAEASMPGLYVHCLVPGNFVVGAGYSTFDLRTAVTEAAWNGSFDFGYNCPRLFGSVRF